ncbi:hypothetical protein Taro_035416 [Colocasia esculenta]|uniref:Uncharacterized protein n=1 Tax=Colocasia esculenta TaxID=4460 RepID=A0A843WAF9_COLES|nr:hypothetical protein [Colocasia esculenta]
MREEKRRRKQGRKRLGSAPNQTKIPPCAGKREEEEEKSAAAAAGRWKDQKGGKAPLLKEAQGFGGRLQKVEVDPDCMGVDLQKGVDPGYAGVDPRKTQFFRVDPSPPKESTPVHLKQFSPKGVDPQFVLESTLTLLESTPAKIFQLCDSNYWVKCPLGPPPPPWAGGGGDANAHGALASPERASAPGAPASTASRGWRGAGHDSALGAGGLAPAAAATRQQQHRAALPPLQAAEAAASLLTPDLPPLSQPTPPPLPINIPMGGEGSVPSGTSGILFRVSADGGTSSLDLGSKVWCCIGDSGSRLSTYVGILLLLRFCCEMVDSLAQSDSEFVDQYFEDWFSDMDPALLDVNSSALAANYRQALDLIDSAPGGTSAPSSDAQAVASSTPNSEFQVVPPLLGIDTSDSLSIYAPSPLTVSNPWSPPVVEQTAWEPWPTQWALVVPVVPLPAPPLTVTLRTREGDLVVAEGYIQLL